ncbi:MAG: ABC transporter permease, partial [Chloroflexi bacterium]|nr:ABC transporter permease [Chloroflexota bacterium]
SKGLQERVVILRHALKNALLPVVTLLGLQIGMLLSNTEVVETIFAVPGLGRGLVSDIVNRDFPLVQMAVLTIRVWFMIVNLAVDVLYGWLDPRIRYQ